MLSERPKTILRIPLVLVLSITIFFAADIACAAENPVDGTVNRAWRDTLGNEGTVSFNTKWWFTDHNGWDGHVTNNNSVKFEHHHVQNDWPRGGHDANDAKRFFDNKWSAQSEGTASPRYNCWSYAFDRTGYWVNSDSEILTNDYNDANKEEADIASWSGHACKVGDGNDNDCNEYVIQEITQKDRGSAIFTFTYTDWDLTLPPHYTSEGSLKKEKETEVE